MKGDEAITKDINTNTDRNQVIYAEGNKYIQKGKEGITKERKKASRKDGRNEGMIEGQQSIHKERTKR